MSDGPLLLLVLLCLLYIPPPPPPFAAIPLPGQEGNAVSATRGEGGMSKQGKREMDAVRGERGKQDVGFLLLLSLSSFFCVPRFGN